MVYILKQVDYPERFELPKSAMGPLFLADGHFKYFKHKITPFSEDLWNY